MLINLWFADLKQLECIRLCSTRAGLNHAKRFPARRKIRNEWSERCFWVQQMNCVYTSAVACESLSQPLGRDAVNVSFPRGISSVCLHGSDVTATTFRAQSKLWKVHVRGRRGKQKMSGMALKKAGRRQRLAAALQRWTGTFSHCSQTLDLR